MKNLKAQAQKFATMGRGGDTLLAHINPREADILKLLGGSGTINPQTGILEFMDGIGGIGGMSHAGAGGFHGGGVDGAGNSLSGYGGNAGYYGPVADPLGDAFSGYGTGTGSMGEGETAADNSYAAISGLGDLGLSPSSYSGLISGQTSTAESMPSVNMGMVNALNAGMNPYEGGISQGGYLGPTLSALNTVASMAVPGYAAIGVPLGLANSAVGALNSLGMSNTGAISGSLSDTARSIYGGVNTGSVTDHQGNVTTAGGVTSPGGVQADAASPQGQSASITQNAQGQPGGLLGLGHDGGAMMPQPLLGSLPTTQAEVASAPKGYWHRGHFIY